MPDMKKHSKAWARPRTASGQAMQVTFLTFANLLDKWSETGGNPNISAWLRSGGVEEVVKIEAEAAPDLRAALERLVSAAEAVAEVENTSIMDRALEQARAALAAPAAPDTTERDFVAEARTLDEYRLALAAPAADGLREVQAREQSAVGAPHAEPYKQPAAAGLDVERLAAAIAEVYGWEPSLKDTEADKIAAAYLREPGEEG